MDCSTPGIPVHHQLPELAQTHIQRVSDAMQQFHPLLSPSPSPLVLPGSRVFLNESILCIRWPKYWSFSFSISHPNEYSWLISFRMDWLNLLAVQGTLKSLLQHHSSKVSILWLSAFFIVQISHPYNWLTWYLCCPRNSQESSSAPQFKSISSSGLSFLYSPALTFIHDYWKNHIFDYTDLCRQCNVSAF